MLITNGKMIVAVDMKKATFLEVMKQIEENAQDLLGNPDIKFPFKEKPYPHCENVADLVFTELKESCGDTVDLQFRAIGDESVQLPGSRIKTVKHYFSPEEKQEIADDLCIKQEEKEQVEEEKKDIAKQYKDRLDGIESSMSSFARKHRMGYEERDKDCHVILNFEEKTKAYVDTDTSEVVHTEDLQPEDYQMKIDSVRGFIPEDEEEQEGMSDDVVDEDNPL